MLFKSSQKSCEWWAKFALALQKYSILKNGTVQNKREVFEMLYRDNQSDQIDLELIMSGVHSDFTIEKRNDFEQSILDNQAIGDATRDELHIRAVSLARRFSISQDFDLVVSYMVEAMLYTLENQIQINKSIRSRLPS
jgi:hypothetical protein